MKEKLQEDLKIAMKGGDKTRMMVLRGLLAEIQTETIHGVTLCYSVAAVRTGYRERLDMHVAAICVRPHAEPT